MTTTGERIRQARERAVLSQGELAELAGISRNTVWQIEHGRKQARPSTVRAIAKALDMLPVQLLGDERP